MYIPWGLMNIKKWTTTLFVLLSMHVSGYSAPPSNDECLSSVFINNPRNFCSGQREFTNIDSRASAQNIPTCWPQGTVSNDVWFSFAPSEPGVFLQLTGSIGGSSGTLMLPSLVMYDGNCNNLRELVCGSVQPGQTNIVELTLTDLVIGRIYYLRVDGRESNTGSFQLCIKTFVPVPEPESDCVKSVILCDKSSFFIENLSGVGTDRNEVFNTCINEEFASVWYTWTASINGSLTFVLQPNNPADDLDFSVYRLPSGIRNCQDRMLIRCMASGETLGASNAQNAPCTGPTGLREGSSDIQEVAGCQLGDDNFLAPLQMIKGETYALIVNNYSQSGFGFSIEFGGTGEFLGPEPDFMIEALDKFECDKTIQFINQSSSNTDSIVQWVWNFGNGSNPLFEIGPGPHDVIYESFGKKITALTVETDKGCRVTKLLELDVAACCADTSTLDISHEVTDLNCFESGDGIIELRGLRGSGDYLYRGGTSRFGPNPIINNLMAGNYNVGVQDSKGCEVSANITINQPEALSLHLMAEKDTVDLGLFTDLFSTFTPVDRMMTYQWSPPDGLSCIDCPNPKVKPPGETTYTLTVIDQDGCQTERTITIYTNNFKPFYAPNVLSLRSQNGNQYFKVHSNIAAELARSIRIYDRWGGLMYEETNVDLASTQYIGWDGRFNGAKVNPGIYVWIVNIRFVDREVTNFAGEFLVVD